MSVRATLVRLLRHVLVVLTSAALLAGCSSDKDASGEPASSSQGSGLVQSAAASPSEAAATPQPTELAAQPGDDALQKAPPPAPEVTPLSAEQLTAAARPGAQPPEVAVLEATARVALERADETTLRSVVELAHALQRPLSADVYVELGEGLLAANKAEVARAVLIAGEREHAGEARFAALIERALDEDPRYLPPVRTLQPDVDLDAIKYLGGGSTIVLRLIKDKTTIAAFKPRQTRLQTDPRAEVAAWRLCPLIRCGFEVPYNEPVRLEWRAFDGLYSRLGSDKQRAYREANFQDLKLVRDEAGVSWVEGTMKAWVPDFTDYPIEISQIWRPWMLQENPLEPMMAGLAVESIDPIRKLHPNGERLVKKLRAHMGAMPRVELARQLSNLIAYDFLINNWDRFSGAKEFWGVNCQFAAGRFVSIDNGASFPRTPSDKVEKQLERVQRFSRQLVAAVRGLDHDKTLARLFPDASDYERERFATFWEQRRLLLEYIDALIAEHGEAAVLAFD